MLTDLDEMRQRPVVVRIAIIIGSILRGKFAEFNGANIFFLQITAKMEEISPENWGTRGRLEFTLVVNTAF